MAIRLILYDVIPLLVGRPPPLEKTALSLVKHMRRYDGRDGYNVLVLEYHDHAFCAAPSPPSRRASSARTGRLSATGATMGGWS